MKDSESPMTTEGQPYKQCNDPYNQLKKWKQN